MSTLPTLSTERLILRPFEPEDAPEVQRLAGMHEIADMTLHIPHPYEDGMAEEWMQTHREQFEEGRQLTLAITDREDGKLLGAIGLQFHKDHRRGELGYWVGVPYWNRGYCTEAAQAMLQYGFVQRGLQKIYASHFARNPASRRVMEKLGMSHEGRLRHHVQKWGRFEDLEIRGILLSEYEAKRGENSA